MIPGAAGNHHALQPPAEDDAGKRASRNLTRQRSKSVGTKCTATVSDGLVSGSRPVPSSDRWKGLFRAPDSSLWGNTHAAPRRASAPFHLNSRYLYKAQTASLKLKQFFSGLGVVQVTIHDIEKEGLRALLRSSAAMCYFLHALLTDHCCENLFFYLEVEQYENYNFSTEGARCRTAAHIVDMYLSRNSILEVNIDDRVSRSVVQALESHMSLATIFEKPKNAVVALMEGSFFKFAKSPIWDRMVADLGSGNLNSHRTQRKAAAVLRDYLRKHPSQNLSCCDFLKLGTSALAGPGLDALDAARLQRTMLIGAMVKEFCLQIVHVDVTDDLHVVEGNDESLKNGAHHTLFQFRWYWKHR